MVHASQREAAERSHSNTFNQLDLLEPRSRSSDLIEFFAPLITNWFFDMTRNHVF